MVHIVIELSLPKSLLRNFVLKWMCYVVTIWFTIIISIISSIPLFVMLLKQSFKLASSIYTLFAMTNKDYNKRSICETSILVVANIIRLSSLRFCGQSFRKDLAPTKGKECSMSKIYKSEITQEMKRRIMKPPKEDPTTLEDVDINAENYINHVRGKIRDSANIQHWYKPKLFSSYLPPPLV